MRTENFVVGKINKLIERLCVTHTQIQQQCGIPIITTITKYRHHSEVAVYLGAAVVEWS